MRLGFYYHITVQSSERGVMLPAYLGVFLDALAAEVEELVLFMHEAGEAEAGQCDYILKGANIIFRSLGPKSPAWDRFLFPGKTLGKMASKVGVCDVILVRAPSPLAPAFHRKFDKKTRIVYLIVGDYTEGVHHLDQPWFRKLMITALSYINDRQLSEAVRKSKTLVNSQKLFNRYVPLTKDINLVRTTTLTKSDFYYRDDTCMGKEVRLLYTGSFSFAKGLRVLLEAFSILYRGNENISLHFVGWEYDPSKPVESFIRKQAVTLGVADRITFHGFKTVGSELNEMYRMADIYIIPSYHEGFPRTIWEAMANSLPVIASNVGSVPHFLENMHDALLIDPGNMQQIVDSVHKILNDSILRRRLIQNGNKLAVQNTLEVLTSHMVNLL